jgi:glycosyltransferase involved in cell wall biosynthesis|tara:strand:+ start:3490 stop:5178 length:1689 start_codon:yes stop_codon:yes gene_type:complete
MKRILFHSNSAKAFTGFGKNAKNILQYLYKTGKYEIIEFANGVQWDHPSLKLRPWKAQGSLPNNPAVIQQLNKDPNRGRAAGYGAEMIDSAIKEYKPDIYIGVEDIWAFSDYWDKPWWNKINNMIWTTLDSQPILPQAAKAAPKTKHFYSWASFAEKDLKKMGHDHVGTLHGTVNTEDFYRQSDTYRKELRREFGITDEFIIGFVFRNQLRKSVPNLLEGFKIFKKDCPNAKLLLHTHWSEGWDIPRLIEEKGLNKEDILTTYYCSACGRYEVRSFVGQEQKCRFCGTEKSLNTTNVKSGVNEEQLNDIYNLMDVYCHPFTSGGMEIPIFEAKMAELVTLVTNYSCGEDSCTLESGSFSLDWSEYREPGTQFIKASTYPSSIAKQIKKVWRMSPEKRQEMGKKAKEWTIKNYSIEAVGKKLESILDNMPEINYDFDWSSKQNESVNLEDMLDDGNRIAVVMPESAGDVLWINSLMSNLKKLYPSYDIYVFTKTQFFDYIEDHPAVYKVLPYSQEIDNLHFLEGKQDHKGYFDMAFLPHYGTQRFHNYHHNGIDKTQFELYEN